MPPIGHRVHHLDETRSTNDDARRLAEAGAAEGEVVFATRQRAGRGRAGRAWASPDGGLYFSVVLRPTQPPATWGLIPIAVGVAVHDALRAHDVPCVLKWPNDVQVESRKVAGILAESRLADPAFAVVGVGVNLNVDVGALPGDVRAVAASLVEWGGPRDPEAVFRSLCEHLESRYRAFEAGAHVEMIDAYKARLATLGRVVNVEGREGVAVDVAADGALVVRDSKTGEEVVVRAAP